MNKQTEALNGLKHLEFISAQLKTYSDQGQYAHIPSNLSAGHCYEIAKEMDNVIQACKEALAQPAQEPVAWINESEDIVTSNEEFTVGWTPLYTHPAPSFIGLSDDEISKVISDEQIPVRTGKTANRFARAIEQALKDKNT